MLFPTFWAFDRRCSSNINEVIAISKFGLLFNLMTYLFDLWYWNTTNFCTESRHICWWKIVKICQSVRDLCVKMWFHLNMNIEGWFCRHGVTSLVMSSAWKYFFLDVCIRSFHIWCEIEATFGNFKNLEIFKSDEILMSKRNFSSVVSLEIRYAMLIAMCITYILSFWSTL